MVKNVIYNSDYIIGTKENIWKSFKEEIINELNDNTIDFEVLQTNINDIINIMKDIQENEDVYPETYLKISECAMGGYTYKVLEEV